MGNAARYNCTTTTMTLMCTDMCMCGQFVLHNSKASWKSGTGVDIKPI